jgi:hypothetical protein
MQVAPSNPQRRDRVRYESCCNEIPECEAPPLVTRHALANISKLIHIRAQHSPVSTDRLVRQVSRTAQFNNSLPGQTEDSSRFTGRQKLLISCRSESFRHIASHSTKIYLNARNASFRQRICVSSE